MCYATSFMGQQAAAPAQQQQQQPASTEDIIDDDAFAWLDALDDEPLGLPASADESAESSQIKTDGTAAAANLAVLQQQQQQQAVAMQTPMSWPIAMAMPPFAPMYAAPWMAMPGPMMAAAQMQATPAVAPAAGAAQGSTAAVLSAPKAAAPAEDAQQAAVVSADSLAPMTKHRKTQQEMDEAIERIKQKRRESAQRSRNRRAAYMKQLENENKALRDEVARLRAALGSVQVQLPIKLAAVPAVAALASPQ